MPGRRSPHARGRRSLKGRGLWSWLKKAASSVHDFVKKNKILSRAGKFIASTGVVPPQYAAGLATATGVADKLGYGRHMRAQRLAGYGIGIAGRGKPSPFIASLMKSMHVKPKMGGALRLAGARRY